MLRYFFAPIIRRSKVAWVSDSSIPRMPSRMVEPDTGDGVLPRVIRQDRGSRRTFSDASSAYQARERVRSSRTRQQDITICRHIYAVPGASAPRACRASCRSRSGLDAAGACSSGRTRRCRCRRPSGWSRYGAHRAWRPSRRSPGRHRSG